MRDISVVLARPVTDGLGRAKKIDHRVSRKRLGRLTIQTVIRINIEGKVQDANSSKILKRMEKAVEDMKQDQGKTERQELMNELKLLQKVVFVLTILLAMIGGYTLKLQ